MKFLLKKILILSATLCFLYSNDIKIGMSGDFSGPISYLGVNMKIGIETYFNTINENSEHKYKLISYDDKYNPITASYNVRKLIDEDKVIALLGNVGTPTSNVTIPITEEKQIVLFGAYSGGNALREFNTNRYVFNYRTSYSEEAYYIVTNLLKKGIKPEEIAVFTQNDTYGDSGLYGVIKAFRQVGYFKLNKIAHGRYTRGTENIEKALSKLLDYDVDFKAIVMVSVDEPSVKFIKYAKEDFPNAKFYTLSPTDITKLGSKLPEYKKDIFTTQVVPILSSDAPIVQEFKENIAKYFPEKKPNLISLEGYIVAKLFVSNLDNLNKETINPNIIYKELIKLKNIDIGLGFSSSFNNIFHQYSNKVWLTTYKNKSVVEVDWHDIEVK